MSTADLPPPPEESGRALPGPAPKPAAGLPLSFMIPAGCAIATGLLLVFFLAFTWGSLHTLSTLTNPYVKSSALVKGFFAKLAQPHATAQKERYIAQHVSVGGVSLAKPTGWWVFGQPAKLEGMITNGGTRILDTVTVGIYFVDGTGRIVAGSEVVIPEIIKPAETIRFSLTAKEAGFEFPKDADRLTKAHRIVDCTFYQPAVR